MYRTNGARDSPWTACSGPSTTMASMSGITSSTRSCAAAAARWAAGTSFTPMMWRVDCAETVAGAQTSARSPKSTADRVSFCIFLLFLGWLDLVQHSFEDHPDVVNFSWSSFVLDIPRVLSTHRSAIGRFGILINVKVSEG